MTKAAYDKIAEGLREAATGDYEGISPEILGMRRGIRLFEQGKPRPPMPADGDLSPKAMEWYGYVVGMFRAFDKRRKVMSMLGIEDRG